jgi:hypothetical protein
LSQNGGSVICPHFLAKHWQVLLKLVQPILDVERNSIIDVHEMVFSWDTTIEAYSSGSFSVIAAIQVLYRHTQRI